jgi:hypothetical protein
MPFPEPNSHDISLPEAAEFTRSYRDSVPAGSILGGLFNAEAVQNILRQPGCAGLRYYYGRNTSGKPVLILVGVTAENEDIYNGVLAEMSWPCPDYCSSANPLNSNT